MKNGKNTIHILSGTVFLAAIAVAGCGGVNSTQNNVAAAGDRSANTSTNAVNNGRGSNSVETASNANSTNAVAAVPGKCTLTKAPEVSGFSIGQTIESLEAAYPGFKVAYDKERANGIEGNKKANFVLLTTGSLPDNGAVEKKFPNLTFIWHFLDGKLMAVVEKDVDAEVKDEKKFVADTATKYGLPTDGWVFDPEGGADLTCGSFTAMVTTGGQPGVGIMITDSASLKLKDDRMKK
jgi:hypothetical protein